MDDLDHIINQDLRLDGLDFESIENALQTNEFLKPSEKTIPGVASGIGTRRRTATTNIKRRFYDLKNVPNAVRLLDPLPKKTKRSTQLWEETLLRGILFLQFSI